MKVTISDAFDYFPGNHGLTEDVIYNSQPVSVDEGVPIFSGSQDNIVPIGFIGKDANNNEGKPITYFEGPCLILTKDGSAGLLTYRDLGLFTINHHACVLKLKDIWEGKIDIEWFGQQYQSSLHKYVTSKSDNRVFSTEWFDRVEFYIPSDVSAQIRQKKKKKSLLLLLNLIDAFSSKLRDLINQVIVCPKDEACENVKLSEIFYFKGGNSGLTEEFVYYNLPSNEGETVEIFTGATLDQNKMGQISRLAKPMGKDLKIFKGPAILIVRKGLAGKMFYIDKDIFTTNDDAYVLTLKRKFQEKVNLKWFIHNYQGMFYNLTTSKSDNATFNKNYAKKQVVRIIREDIQDAIAKKIENLQLIISKQERIRDNIKRLLNTPMC